ncbi:hypothetical protein THAOC_01119 [Thalassiosira oceanica]|uniref:Uncharacterized protein n=1 Tax=Thalassiosira oceanica TaxID=159749 RepID=K0TEF3_THAOC|nr:hypothetical protein THAOC_01119 [Thalassiosira oceanica]|eukprot:EJK77083.1 hypothetical protein THAOC_01119 [Thalassiosira oceanica]
MSTGDDDGGGAAGSNSSRGTSSALEVRGGSPAVDIVVPPIAQGGLGIGASQFAGNLSTVATGQSGQPIHMLLGKLMMTSQDREREDPPLVAPSSTRAHTPLLPMFESFSVRAHQERMQRGEDARVERAQIHQERMRRDENAHQERMRRYEGEREDKAQERLEREQECEERKRLGEERNALLGLIAALTLKKPGSEIDQEKFASVVAEKVVSGKTGPIRLSIIRLSLLTSSRKP